MSRHLFKMLVGLLGMALIGAVLLLIVSLYQKQTRVAGDTTTPVSQDGSATPVVKVPGTISHTPKGATVEPTTQH